MVNVAKEKTITLPVSGEQVKLRRLSWGERLEIEDVVTDQRTGKTDMRMLHAVMVERATDGLFKKEKYLAMDINDGFVLRAEVQEINGIDSAFLQRYAPAAVASADSAP